MIAESIATTILCLILNGETETRHNYKLGYIKVDCETSTHVIEAGLDKRSSLDSIQQAVFAATLTNKQPMIVIYDTDGKEGKYEYRIKTACNRLGIAYINYSVS